MPVSPVRQVDRNNYCKTKYCSMPPDGDTLDYSLTIIPITDRIAVTIVMNKSFV